jgi:glycine/D-amino acid oxidase-like deaminating enzyme
MNSTGAPTGHGAGPVAVVGAGIIGAMTALHLRRLGLDVVLIDRAEPGSGCSFGNGGAISPDLCVPMALPGMLRRVPGWFADPLGPLVVRWQSLPSALPWLIRWIRAGRMERVEQLAKALRALHGPSLRRYSRLLGPDAAGLIERTGQLYVWTGDTAGPTEQLARDLRSRNGVESRALDADEIYGIDPELAPGFRRGLFFPDNGHTVNPQRLVQTLVDYFLEAGGKLRRDNLVAVERSGGRAARLALESGERLPIASMVLATGIDAKGFARQLGDAVPLQAERGYHVMLPNPRVRPVIKISNRDHMFGMTPMEHGVRISGTVEIAAPEAPFNEKRAWGLLEQARRMYPRLDAQGATVWMGCRPSTPDSLPVIGRARRAPNVVYAFGHGHSGLTGAPMTAELVAHWMLGTDAPIDPAPYLPGRF